MSGSKNFLVVGGSSGIGLALSKQLITNNHQVWSASRSGKVHDGVQAISYDATKDEFPSNTLPEQLDGLAYCPGTINLKPFHRLSDQEFLDDFQLNVLGAIRVIRTVLPLLKNSDQASVVLFSTVAVSQGMSFHASVAASKGALEGLTRSLAAELAPKIRVNCIAPSLTNTPLAGRILSSDEKIKASHERHPLKRIGEPDDIASLATFLLSESSSWMTGQVLGLDGGMSSIRGL